MSDLTSSFQFHHVQVFVNEVKPLDDYKMLEERLNALAHKGQFDPFSGRMRFLEPNAHESRVKEGKMAWQEVCKDSTIATTAFTSSGQDLVEQLIVGLGWRVTADYNGVGTRSVLVTSADPCGVKLCITAASHEPSEVEHDEPYSHFSSHHAMRFMEAHNGRQCFGVLGFEVPAGALEGILQRYKQKHPKLLLQDRVHEYLDVRSIKVTRGEATAHKEVELGRMQVLEVFAYYKDVAKSIPDAGTVLRFVERSGSYASRPGFANPEGVLPGLRDADAHFDGTSIPAYSDHWVSNVQDRVGFLSTLHDTLGFVPKVEFNAGVVAAGKAQIESTVAGNSDAPASITQAEALKNQSQVYLPVNNSLSDVGHVHAFLQQLGQGVQHLASRVEDLVSFVERVNNYRTMTGRGLSFLSIPRSYYGILTAGDLTRAGASEKLAHSVCQALETEQIKSKDGIVTLNVSSQQLEALPVGGGAEVEAEWAEKRAELVGVILRGRYKNMYELLRDSIEESLYLQIVRNQILVDVQGGDILFQIFTCKVLQAAPEHEAPFLEFIQRLCKQCQGDQPCTLPIKAGCGGFGIRNFLTLFLSIELSKALQDERAAEERGDSSGAAGARQRVRLLTAQLGESNPILTAISDAMAEEGAMMEAVAAAADEEKRREARAAAAAAGERKRALTESLQQLSDRYAQLTSLPPPVLPEV